MQAAENSCSKETDAGASTFIPSVRVHRAGGTQGAGQTPPLPTEPSGHRTEYQKKKFVATEEHISNQKEEKPQALSPTLSSLLTW